MRPPDAARLTDPSAFGRGRPSAAWTPVTGALPSSGSTVHDPAAGDLITKYVVSVASLWKAIDDAVSAFVPGVSSIRTPPGPTSATCGGAPWPVTATNPDGAPSPKLTVRAPPACAAAATAR